MSIGIEPNHPKQKLMFYVAQDVNEQIRKKVRGLLEQLVGRRLWVIAPPKFVDAVDEPEEGTNDAPVETLGGELDIYSALSATKLSKDVDRQHLEEVEEIVEGVRLLSEKEELTFEFVLDGTYVGAIEDGTIDRTLKVGLLDEWRKHVSS